MVVSRGGWEGGNGELLFNGYKVSVMQDEYVLELIGQLIKSSWILR